MKLTQLIVLALAGALLLTTGHAKRMAAPSEFSHLEFSADVPLPILAIATTGEVQIKGKTVAKLTKEEAKLVLDSLTFPPPAPCEVPSQPHFELGQQEVRL